MHLNPTDHRVFDTINEYYSRIADIKISGGTDPAKAMDAINKLMAHAFEVLEALGDDEIRPYLEKLLVAYAVLLATKDIDDNTTFQNIMLKLRVRYGDVELFQPNQSHLLVRQFTRFQDLAQVVKNASHVSLDPFINSIGPEHKQALKEGNKLNYHNILVLVLFQGMYMEADRAQVITAIETSKAEQQETKYIEIVENTQNMVDFAAIEEAMTSFDIQGDPEQLYEDALAISEVALPSSSLLHDEAVQALMAKGFILPILHDFLRYHKHSDATEAQKEAKQDVVRIRNTIAKNQAASQVYTSKADEANKLFYQPMINRAAIVINDIEEARLLSKASSDPALLASLAMIRQYPYQRYADDGRPSLVIEPTDSVTSLRLVTFEYGNDKRFAESKLRPLEWRVANGRCPGTMVGFVATVPSLRWAGCRHATLFDLRYGDLTNAKSIDAVKDYYARALADPSGLKKPVFFFGTADDDAADEATIRATLLGLYDVLLLATFDAIKAAVERHPTGDAEELRRVAAGIQARLLDIPVSSPLAERLEFLIKNGAKAKAVDEDDNERIRRIDKPVRIPTVSAPPVRDAPVIRVTTEAKKDGRAARQQESVAPFATMCQHELDWEEVLRVKRLAPISFNQTLFEFLKRYIMQNKVGTFVCRSCYRSLDTLSDYVAETHGDQVVLASTSLHTDLESIPEYAQYIKTVKNMEKVIEKLCYAANVTAYFGNNAAVKMHRQNFIKTVVDLVVAHHATLHHRDGAVMRKRILDAAANYKIGADLTRFFLFPMDNDIFTFSSGDTDKFKKLKLNNLYLYIMFYLVCDLTSSSILIFPNDRYVNYAFFEAFGLALFKDIRIHVSDKDEVALITSYPLLCYVIYYLSSLLVKFHLWYSDVPYDQKNVKQYPQVLRYVVHSFIDLINSVLLVNTRPTKNYIYELYATRFFSKLHTTYSADKARSVLDALKKAVAKKFVRENNKLRFSSDGNKVARGTPVVSLHQLRLSHESKNAYLVRPKRARAPPQQAMKGEYHRLDATKTAALRDALKAKSLRKLVTHFAPDGTKRTELAPEEDYQKHADYDRYQTGLMQHRNHAAVSHAATKESGKAQALGQLADKPVSHMDYMAAVGDFVKALKAQIGSDTIINRERIELDKDRYVITNDYMGNRVPPIVLYEGDVLIKTTKMEGATNGPPLEVFAFTDKVNNVHMYYAVIDGCYIGYRDGKGAMTLVKNTDSYIRVEPGLAAAIRLLGYEGRYVKVTLDKYYDLRRATIGVARNRLAALKKVLAAVRRDVSVLASKQSPGSRREFAFYASKIRRLVTATEEQTLFENSGVYEALTLDPVKDVKVVPVQLQDQTFLPCEVIDKYFTNDKHIVLHILRQLQLLLQLNQDNAAVVALFIREVLLKHAASATGDLHAKRFRFILSNNTFADEDDEGGYGSDADLSPEEREKQREEKEDANEEADALDVDVDPDTDADEAYSEMYDNMLDN